MPGQHLVDRIGDAKSVRFAGEVFRHHGTSYDALDASGSRIFGGRWNPRESFPVLYLALDRETAIRELQRMATSQGLRMKDLLPRALSSMEVVLNRVLDLTDPETRASIGVELKDLLAADPGTTQAMGEAAHRLGFEAIKAPSAIGQGEILAVLVDNRQPGSRVELRSNEIMQDPPFP